MPSTCAAGPRGERLSTSAPMPSQGPTLAAEAGVDVDFRVRGWRIGLVPHRSMSWSRSSSFPAARGPGTALCPVRRGGAARRSDPAPRLCATARWGYGTGGPKAVEKHDNRGHCFPAPFTGWEVRTAPITNAEIDDGHGPLGRSALVDFRRAQAGPLAFLARTPAGALPRLGPLCRRCRPSPRRKPPSASAIWSRASAQPRAASLFQRLAHGAQVLGGWCRKQPPMIRGARRRGPSRHSGPSARACRHSGYGRRDIWGCPRCPLAITGRSEPAARKPSTVRSRSEAPTAAIRTIGQRRMGPSFSTISAMPAEVRPIIVRPRCRTAHRAAPVHAGPSRKAWAAAAIFLGRADRLDPEQRRRRRRAALGLFRGTSRRRPRG